MVRGLQVRRNKIDKDTAVSGVILFLLSSLLKQMSFFTDVTYALRFIPLCCIFVISLLSLYFLAPSAFSHIIGCSLLISFFVTSSTIDMLYFLSLVDFHLIWVSNISGWKIGRHDPAWTACSLIKSFLSCFPVILFYIRCYCYSTKINEGWSHNSPASEIIKLGCFLVGKSWNQNNHWNRLIFVLFSSFCNFICWSVELKSPLQQ